MFKKLNNSILIIVDHKHRDLPALSLIGYFLEKRFKYKINYVATALEEPLIKKYNPKYIIIPKITYGIFNQLKWKLQGRKIIIVETEGNSQNDKVMYNVDIYPDLYLFWNKISYNRYYEKLKKHGSQMIIGGNHRSDLFCNPYKKIFNSEKIKNKLGINKDSKVITFATSTQEAHLKKEKQILNKKKTNRAYKYHPPYNILIESLNIQKQITEEFLKKSANLKDENIVIVVKPHPHESINYWKDFFKRNNLKNCFLMYGTNINELLCISEIHISQGVCNTTAEAKLWGLKTIEVKTKFTDKIYSYPHTDLADYSCYSSEDLYKLIADDFTNKNLNIDNKLFEKYKTDYFNRVDGENCYRYSSYINDFILNLKSSRINLLDYTKYMIYFILMNIRNILFYTRKEINRYLKMQNLIKKLQS